jgi:hypothetical protein
MGNYYPRFHLADMTTPNEPAIDIYYAKKSAVKQKPASIQRRLMISWLN